MARMDRVLEIDDASRIARIQAGAFGPALEEQLNARGWTIGHFPDSFTHSTLGGWIATRSSGMQSDKYGDVADLTRAVRVVTPAGTLVTRPVPTTSTGPSVREMVLGSEGRLGIISEATVHVHRLPERRIILGYLLPDWAPRARRRCGRSPRATPRRRSRACRTRPETRFSFATRKAPTTVDRLKSKGLTAFLERKSSFGDLEQMCLAFVGYEGAKAHVATQRKLVGQDRVGARRRVHRLEPGRALRPEEVRHPLHPRLPARPRRARRRVGDLGPVGRRCRSSTTT